MNLQVEEYYSLNRRLDKTEISFEFLVADIMFRYIYYTEYLHNFAYVVTIDYKRHWTVDTRAFCIEYYMNSVHID